MKCRWAAMLIVFGVARGAFAGDLPPAPPPPVSLVEPLVPPPPPSSGVGAPLAGAATMLVPFIVGCALWAENGQREQQRLGTIFMATGFAAAPWVSHGLQREWKRAAIFGGISTALAATSLGLMAWKDPFDPDVLNRKRVAFGVMLTTAMFAAAVGVFDSLLIAQRAGDGS